MKPMQLRGELTQGRSAAVRRRRWIAGVSLIGAASMAIISLRQLGVIGAPPDLPLPGFNSDAVDLSPTAYALGLPDATLGVATFAANLPLASFGGADRASATPWVSLAVTAKAAADAAVSLWYLYQQPAREHAWCTYCLLGEAAAITIFALTLPEAKSAFDTLCDR